MINKTYSLATRTEADCDQPWTQVPISGIKPGDIVVFGIGTLQLHYAEVVSVDDNYNSHGYFLLVTCAGGRTFADTPGGFWSTVIKADPKARESAAAFSAAYAHAWDRRR